MTTTITGDSVNTQVTSIDSANTTAYTTVGESVILVDTSTAAVTITLSTADATASDPETRLTIIDTAGNAATNNISVDTEGGETIDGASSLTIGINRGRVEVQSNGSNWTTARNKEFSTIATDQAGITGQSYVVAHRASDTSSQTSGTWVNIVDTEDRDSENEFDANFAFTPPETADYWIDVLIRVDGTAGDTYQVRLHNTTDSTNEDIAQYENVASDDIIPYQFRLELTASKAYELQVTDVSNSFIVEDDSRMSIVKPPVHA